MKQYLAHKTLTMLREQCATAGLELDTRLYDDAGHDHVVVRSADAEGNNKVEVFFNTVSGRFFGRTPDGLGFNSDGTEFDNEPWFQALLDFFLVPLPASALAPARAPVAALAAAGAV